MIENYAMNFNIT